jgi:hypothetical protein
VNATKTAAKILRRLAQLKSSFTCSPIFLAPIFPDRVLDTGLQFKIITPQLYCGVDLLAQRLVKHCPKGRVGPACGLSRS